MKPVLDHPGEEFSKVYLLQAGRYAGKDGGKLAIYYCKKLKVGQISYHTGGASSYVLISGARFMEAVQEPTDMPILKRAMAPYRRDKYEQVGIYWTDVEIQPTGNGSRLLVLKKARSPKSWGLYIHDTEQAIICDSRDEAFAQVSADLQYIGVPGDEVEAIKTLVWSKFC